MFRSLRSRLLITYLSIITIALLLMALALLAISASQASRVLPTLRQLSGVAQGTRRELARLVEQGTSLPEIRKTLSETASEQGVRIEANSQVGLGSTFTIYLPINDLPPRRGERREE